MVRKKGRLVRLLDWICEKLFGFLGLDELGI